MAAPVTTQGLMARLRQPIGAPAAPGKRKPSDRRTKPNPILMAVLGLVLVAGVVRVAMPSLFGAGGGGAVASFPPPVLNRHLVHHAATPATATGSATGTTTPVRSARDPFSPPPGYHSS